jgi:hypothetical protein
LHKAGAVQVIVPGAGVSDIVRWMIMGVPVTAGVYTAGITVRTGWITESEIAAAVTGAVITRRRMKRKNAGNHFILKPWIISI